jgi:hypothetical protein
MVSQNGTGLMLQGIVEVIVAAPEPPLASKKDLTGLIEGALPGGRRICRLQRLWKCVASRVVGPGPEDNALRS